MAELRLRSAFHDDRSLHTGFKVAGCRGFQTYGAEKLILARRVEADNQRVRIPRVGHVGPSDHEVGIGVSGRGTSRIILGLQDVANDEHIVFAVEVLVVEPDGDFGPYRNRELGWVVVDLTCRRGNLHFHRISLCSNVAGAQNDSESQYD